MTVYGFRHDGSCDPVVRTFADVAAMEAAFQLTNVVSLRREVLAAAATGTPHVAVCPYSNEIDDVRELNVRDSLDDLRMAHESGSDSI